jgi:hypothetical protein
MLRLPTELYNRCRSVLLNCNEFDSHASLQTLFVTAELHPFRNSLPEASSKSGRIDACLDFLLLKRLSNGQPVFPMFLTALRDRYQIGDSLWDEIEALHREIEKKIIAQTHETWSSPEDHLFSFLTNQANPQFAGYMLSKASQTTLPPLGVTSTSILDKISLLIKDKIDALNATEAYILLAAVCLPYLLRLREEFSGEAINPYQVRQLARYLDQQENAPDGIGDSLIEIVTEVTAVANAYNAFIPENDIYSPARLHNQPINLRLLGALLHFANRLNLDQFVDPEPPPSIEQATQLEKFQWWRQAYVRNVSIESQRLQLHIRFPEGYKELYEPILAAPLDEEIKELYNSYDPLFEQVGINLNIRPAVVTERPGLPVIPSEEWHQLKETILTEQARKSKDRLQQDVVWSQRLWDSLVKAEVIQAEQMICEEKHLDGATAFARAAALLGKSHQASQARAYATRAAENYLIANDKLAAAEQYLYAADVWLNNRTTPELAARQLDEAGKLIRDINDPVLQIRLLHTQAWLAFATLRDQDVHRLWEQIITLIPQVTDDVQRTCLWRTSALQQFSFAMVWEEWETAHQALDTALRNCPATESEPRLDLLQSLLVLSAEQGEWELADTIYREAQELLDTKADPVRSGLLAMHYAASLARRGALQNAYDTYSLAIQQLDGHADGYNLGLVYRNMQHMLLRNGATFFSGFEKHEGRRVDFFSSTQKENRGYAHRLKAESELIAEKYNGVLQHIRLALACYWREGSWSGIEHAYRILAKLNSAVGKPIEALLDTIRAGNSKTIEQYAKPLQDINDHETLAEIIDLLIEVRPAACEQQVAVKALGILADVVPPEKLSQTLDHLLLLLQGPEGHDQHVYLRRNTTESLRKLADQLNTEQTSRVLTTVLEQLQRQQHWTVTEQLLKLLDECFVQRQPRIEQALYGPVAEAMLSFSNDDNLQTLANRVLGQLGRTAPSSVRERLVTFFRDRMEQRESLIYLAHLKEPIPKDLLENEIEGILQAINRRRVVVGPATMIEFGGTSPRALNIFNELLYPKLFDRVIDGLLQVIINQHNDLGTRSSAIWTLCNLPAEALFDRADEVSEYLMWGAEEDSVPRSEQIKWELESQTDPFSSVRMNTGTVLQVRRDSHWALGRLYSHLNQTNKKLVSLQLVSGSQAPYPLVRLGTAMALKIIKGPLDHQQRLLLSLMVLMHDPEPKTCSFACAACGHLLRQRLTEPFTEDLIERLINLAETSLNVEIRTGAAIGLRHSLALDWIDEGLRYRIPHLLEILSNDTSFKVRREASTPVEDG